MKRLALSVALLASVALAASPFIETISVSIPNVVGTPYGYFSGGTSTTFDALTKGAVITVSQPGKNSYNCIVVDYFGGSGASLLYIRRTTLPPGSAPEDWSQYNSATITQAAGQWIEHPSTPFMPVR